MQVETDKVNKCVEKVEVKSVDHEVDQQKVGRCLVVVEKHGAFVESSYGDIEEITNVLVEVSKVRGDISKLKSHVLYTIDLVGYLEDFKFSENVESSK